jgi:hypothetical protein
MFLGRKDRESFCDFLEYCFVAILVILRISKLHMKIENGENKN